MFLSQRIIDRLYLKILRIIELYNYYNEAANDRQERGDNGRLLHLSPKFFNNVFLFVGWTTLETLLNFDWLSIKLNIQTFQPLILI